MREMVLALKSKRAENDKEHKTKKDKVLGTCGVLEDKPGKKHVSD